MKITADTNLLVRAALRDDDEQASRADNLLRDADVVAITSIVLCEFFWVLQRLRRYTRGDIEKTLDALLRSANIRVHRPAVEAGMAAYRAGGDFADGVIAYEGRALGGEVFVSFDKQAVSILQQQGHSALLASALS